MQPSLGTDFEVAFLGALMLGSSSTQCIRLAELNPANKPLKVSRNFFLLAHLSPHSWKL